MAGIVKRANGIYSVRVMVGNDRRTISLGTRSEARADAGTRLYPRPGNVTGDR